MSKTSDPVEEAIKDSLVKLATKFDELAKRVAELESNKEPEWKRYTMPSSPIGQPSYPNSWTPADVAELEHIRETRRRTIYW